MKIVAFGHRQRVGKDTATRILITQLKSANSRINVVRVGFADKLKELAEEAYGWAGLQGIDFYENHPEFKDRPLPAIGKSPREIWLALGKYYNEICPVTFCHLALKRADCDIMVISDLRRPEEARFLQKFGAYLCKIERPGTPKLEDLIPGQMLDAKMESWDQWYRTFTNDSDLRALNDKLQPLTQELLGSLP